MGVYLVEAAETVKRNGLSEVPFHVKLRSLRTLGEDSGLESEKVNDLFTNAEIPEDHVQDVLHVHPAGYPP